MTIRDVAGVAGVPPALVVRHYQPRDGLRDAVDDHAGRNLEAVLAEIAPGPAAAAPSVAAALTGLAGAAIRHLPAGSPVPARPARMLIAGGPAAAALLRRLRAASQRTLSELAGLGLAPAGGDRPVRAAFLPVNDLAVLTLPARPPRRRPRCRSAAGRRHAALGAGCCRSTGTGWRLPRLVSPELFPRGHPWEESSALIHIITCHRCRGGLGRRTAAGPLARPRACRALPGTPGVLLGSRLLMLEHLGRKSGARRFVVLEVVARPRPGTYVVASGFGARAQWFRNVRANPHVRIYAGGRRPAPATARLLTSDETAPALAAYAAGHPRAWAALKPVFETTLGARISDQETSLPMIAFEVAGGCG